MDWQQSGLLMGKMRAGRLTSLKREQWSSPGQCTRLLASCAYQIRADPIEARTLSRRPARRYPGPSPGSRGASTLPPSRFPHEVSHAPFVFGSLIAVLGLSRSPARAGGQPRPAQHRDHPGRRPATPTSASRAARTSRRRTSTRWPRAASVCTNGYVSGPYCSPTRAGLLTGRYQQRFGHEFNPGSGPELGLPLTETTIADRLKAAGYATGLVGKWHLGAAPKFHPQRRGFDEFFGFLGGAHAYFPGGGRRGPIYPRDHRGRRRRST